MSNKERVDSLLVKQGICQSREQAKRYIMAGQIYNEKEQRLDKPGEKIPITSVLKIKGELLKYVSRGGLKLEKAMTVFQADFKDQIILDIGSSTGGFTDVALQSGAKKSYALDVGTNQLDWKIRSDQRVVVMEQVNFRHATKEMFQEGIPDIATIDVSFISLKLILQPLVNILKQGGDVYCLIKPQFEAGREQVGKKGLIKSKSVHAEVILNVFQQANSLGYDVLGLTFSPITGGTGNIEFLGHLRNEKRHMGERLVDQQAIKKIVEAAHHQFEEA